MRPVQPVITLTAPPGASRSWHGDPELKRRIIDIIGRHRQHERDPMIVERVVRELRAPEDVNTEVVAQVLGFPMWWPDMFRFSRHYSSPAHQSLLTRA